MPPKLPQPRITRETRTPLRPSSRVSTARSYGYRPGVEPQEAKQSKSLRKKRDQELIELLNELRVALPGAQVLLAFLLVAPLNAGLRRGGATGQGGVSRRR